MDEFQRVLWLIQGSQDTHIWRHIGQVDLTKVSTRKGFGKCIEKEAFYECSLDT